MLRRDELDGHPEQRKPADQLEIRQFQQCRDDAGKKDQQNRRSAGAENHAPEPFLWRQRADRERDHDRVVTGQQNIDPHDLQRSQPKCRPHHLVCQHFHEWPPRFALSIRHKQLMPMTCSSARK
jgi:hypothetical protein